MAATKYELAQYLINLHNLMLAQQAAGVNLASTTLSEEYDRNWGLLKDSITNPEETDDE